MNSEMFEAIKIPRTHDIHQMQMNFFSIECEKLIQIIVTYFVEFITIYVFVWLKFYFWKYMHFD